MIAVKRKHRIDKDVLLAWHDALIVDSLAWTALMMETGDKEKKLEYIGHAEAIDKQVDLLDGLLGIDAAVVSERDDSGPSRRPAAHGTIEIEYKH